jgi:hypothetical protein
VLTDDPPVTAVIDCLVELIREEVPQLLRARKNWKLVINASGGGDITAVVEKYSQLTQRYKLVVTHIVADSKI